MAQVLYQSLHTEKWGTNITRQALREKWIDDDTLHGSAQADSHKGYNHDLAMRGIQLEEGHASNAADSKREHELVSRRQFICVQAIYRDQDTW